MPSKATAFIPYNAVNTISFLYSLQYITRLLILIKCTCFHT